MSTWTNFCKYFQVSLLICIIVALLVVTGFLFADKVYLDHNAVYAQQVTARLEFFEENNIPVPTKTELAWLSIIFRIVIICVAPACLFIYHSRLLTLDAFLHLKKH